MRLTAGETGSEDDVGFPLEDRGEKLGVLARVVL